MSAVSFTVPGEPVAFARTRGIHRMTPAPQRAWMAHCGTMARLAMRGREPLEGALQLDVKAVHAIPASWPKAKASAATWKTSVPDADNLAKLCADSLKGIVWRDDAQAARLVVEKVYGPAPCVEVKVSPL